MKVVKGAKAGSGKSRTPNVAADSAQSITYSKILYGLGEGEIEGLANGWKSVYLDDTPILDANGNANFENVTYDFRNGTNDQDYIEGFPETSNQVDVNTELTTQWVRSISNTDIDAVRVLLKWGALRTTNASNGDVTGVTIKYAIDISADGSAYTEVLNTQISDKTSDNYTRAHRIDLPKATSSWNIRVRRLTPPANSDYITDKMYVAAYAEVIDSKFRYPNTALLSLQYDAKTFSSVAKVAVEAKGLKIRVPSNYNPESRTYTGIWDGSFKRVYSNNPAWIYFDLCTAKRYGLGERITESMLDKASLYRLGQYCDGMVSDGEGGLEPRFTCNVYLQSAEDAYSVLSKLAGLFRAISYWDGDSIICEADAPDDVYYSYSNANVIDGNFEYSGTRARDRHNVAKVAWNDPKNRYKTDYEIVRDERAIAEDGTVKIVDVDAWGCTSRGQAQRAGLWALRSEQNETQTVTFKVGLDGQISPPGKVISVADNNFAGRFIGGRVKAVSVDRKTITLDREIQAQPNDVIYINSGSGQAVQGKIFSIDGVNVTVVDAFKANEVAAQNVFTVDSSDLKTRKFRVVSLTQDEDHQFTITALEYNSAKYDAIDNGAYIEEAPVSIINPVVQAPVTNVAIESYDSVQQGLNVVTMVIKWDKADYAVKYLVEWRKDDGSWVRMPTTGNTSVEVQGVYAGSYQARVTAISAFDVTSLVTSSTLTSISGKQGKPPKLAFIRAIGTMFGMKVEWGFPATGALDTAYTEIQYSTTSNGANSLNLGSYAYPTTSMQQQGLAANVTLWYRGRLVDRIGNVGDWSDWTSGTSTAQVSDILDALSGQISETQLSKDLATKIDKIDTIAGLDSDIGNLVDDVSKVKADVAAANQALNKETQDRITGINNLSNSLNQEIQDRTTAVQSASSLAQKANDDLATERTERLTSIAAVNDGLTTEIQSRKDGDAANTLALNNYKSSNDSALANVRQTAETAVSGNTSNANLINALDSRVTVAEDNASTAKTNAASAVTKAQTAVDAAGSASSLAQQASATATAAKTSADKASTDSATAITNSATALSTANAAATASSAASSKADSVEAKLGNYATTTALSTVDAKVTTLDGKVSANTTKIDGVYAQINPAMAGSDTDLIGNDSIFVGVWSEQSARIENDMALGIRIDTNVAQINNVQALAQQETTARVSGDEANLTALNTYIAKNDTALASVQQKAESAVSGNSSNGLLINALDNRVTIAEGNASEAKTNSATAISKAQTAVDTASSASTISQQAQASAASALSTANTANTNAGTALSNSATALTQSKAAADSASAASSKVDSVQASLSGYATTGALSSTNSNVALIDNKLTSTTTKVDGIYAQVNPAMAGSSDDLIGSDTAYVGVWTESSARIEGDLAQSIRTDQVVAQQAQNNALYQQQIEANATAIAANVSATSTLQTTVNGNTASIQSQQISINGLSARATLKLQSGNLIGGVGISNDSQTVDFIVQANKFAIGAPSTTTDSVTPAYAFVYQSTATTLPNGTVVPKGLYLDSAYIGSINANKINADSLSAISANLGTIQVDNAHIKDLAVTSGKIADLSVGTLKIQDRSVTVPLSSIQSLSVNYSTRVVNTISGWTYDTKLYLSGISNISTGSYCTLFFRSDIKVQGGATIQLLFNDIVIAEANYKQYFAGVTTKNIAQEGGESYTVITSVDTESLATLDAMSMYGFVMPSGVTESTPFILRATYPAKSGYSKFSVTISKASIFLVEFKK